MEIAAKTPTLLLRAVLSSRVQLQSRHPSLCPLVIDLGGADSWGAMESPWLEDDDCTHGFLVHDNCEFKVVFHNLNGGAAICSAIALGRLAAVHPATFSPETWLSLDFESILARGQTAITIHEDGSAPPEWVNAVDELVATYRGVGLQGFEATYVGFDETVAPSAFVEALKGFPEQFVATMYDLAGEIDHLVGHIVPVGDLDFEQVDRISEGCIGALVPGIRALAYHGFGWPSLDPSDAKMFLRNIQDAQPVSVAEIVGFNSGVTPDECEDIVRFLIGSGLVTTDGTKVSVVTLPDFFAKQRDAIASGADASRHVA